MAYAVFHFKNVKLFIDYLLLLLYFERVPSQLVRMRPRFVRIPLYFVRIPSHLVRILYRFVRMHLNFVRLFPYLVRMKIQFVRISSHSTQLLQNQNHCQSNLFHAE